MSSYPGDERYAWEASRKTDQFLREQEKAKVPVVYRVAEKFKSVQGEGVYAGTPMAFIRFVGCSVGKKICQHCDTDFDTTMPWRGGGEFSAERLMQWAEPYQHICFTGGEPLDQDLYSFLHHAENSTVFHVETSGTKPLPEKGPLASRSNSWICVSPKPGFLEDVVLAADEVKVIVPGLGTDESLARMRQVAEAWKVAEASTSEVHPLAAREGFRWPTLEDALRWAKMGKIVFLQPRNAKNDVDKQNLLYVQDLIRDHPQLRLSVQLHKILKVQ